MTDQELHKLSRKELLELLLEQSRQLDSLQEQLQQAQAQLTNRQLLLDKAGSIAEASLQLNRVFEAAQAAAEQYLENVQILSARQTEVCQRLEAESQQKADALLSEMQTRCRTMEAETRAKCEAMIREAEENANQVWQQTQEKIRQVIGQHSALKDLVDIIGGEKTSV